jgi:hypothetical protein
MPSESANMPHETHESLLRHGESRGLRLQAYEVAFRPKKKNNEPFFLTVAFIMSILGLLILAKGT